MRRTTDNTDWTALALNLEILRTLDPEAFMRIYALIEAFAANPGMTLAEKTAAIMFARRPSTVH